LPWVDRATAAAEEVDPRIVVATSVVPMAEVVEEEEVGIIISWTDTFLVAATEIMTWRRMTIPRIRRLRTPHDPPSTRISA